MYWPIGPAKAYQQHLPPDLSEPIHDGLDLSRKTRQKARHAQRAAMLEAHDGARNEGTPRAGEEKSTTESTGTRISDAGVEDGAIIGLCVSRHGHIFATITKTTLTVWLTKVQPKQTSEHWDGIANSNCSLPLFSLVSPALQSR